MSAIIPFAPKQIDPLSEVLAAMDPANADALQLMRSVFSNQIAISAALASQGLHIITADGDVYELADSVACNALPQVEQLAKELETLEL